MSPLQKPAPRHQMCRSARLAEPIAFIERNLHKVLARIPNDGDSDWVKFPGGRKFMASMGHVPPHTDPAFGPWLYFLFLKAEDGSILRSYGNAPLALKPGLLVELNVRRRHSASVPSDEACLVWHHIESETRISLRTALEKIYRTMA